MSVVAGLVIETAEGAAPRVAARLVGRGGIEIHGGDGDRRLAAVWTADTGASLEELAEHLLATIPDLLGVYPTFVAENAEETGP